MSEREKLQHDDPEKKDDDVEAHGLQPPHGTQPPGRNDEGDDDDVEAHGMQPPGKLQ